ncbi:MAG: hypothetical protein GY808_01600 [Gammaproteobacteria bacterium]|nr:hypothetical protein [Gammaproteobacteria bacterium]MCP4990197.1 hypothetical protein [Colwellia sp.]
MNEMRSLPIPIPIPISWSGRLLYACVTIVLPIASFILAFDGNFGPEWQSGKFSDYTGIMFEGTVSRIFYPFLAYSIISMFFLLVSPLRFSKYFIVRLGIYSGIILSLQYAILLSISYHNTAFYGFVAVGILLPFGIKWIHSRSIEKFGLKITWFIIIGLVLCFLLIYFISDLFQPGSILFPALMIFITGPFWCLIIATLVSIRLLRTYELSRQYHIKHSLGILVWLVSFIGAWRIAVLKTLEVYASLPTSSPDCYIATAAAKGHPRFVKSKPVATGDNRTVQINIQVKNFKCAELALMTVFPGGHKICRRLYDCVGTRLAHIVTHPILADMVYVSLKPIEWSFRTIMRIFIPNIDEFVHQIYTDVS